MSRRTQCTVLLLAAICVAWPGGVWWVPSIGLAIAAGWRAW